MKILAYLNEDKIGCDYSGLFRDKWINNEKLHHKCKAIEVEEKKTFLKPVVMIIDDAGNLLLEQKDAMINLKKLQDFILKHNG